MRAFWVKLAHATCSLSIFFASQCFALDIKKTSETMTTTSATGEQYTLDVVGSFNCEDGGLCLMGQGQKMLDKDIVATSYSIADISPQSIKLKGKTATIQFLMDKNTVVCLEDKKAVLWNVLTKNDKVVVRHKPSSSTALSICRGPIVLKIASGSISDQHTCDCQK